MSQLDTKTRILDAGEHLFARDGFHNTSLRAITSLAKVNLAAVNYHFGSKEALLQTVIERRLLPLNQLRKEQIDAVLAAAAATGAAPSARALLRAFIEPTLAFRSAGPGAQDFISLVGRSMSEPDETVRNCFIGLVLPNFRLFFESLQLALPQLPTAVLMARVQFTIGAMSHVMCTSHKPIINDPSAPKPLDDTALIEQLLQFVTSGLEAPQ